MELLRFAGANDSHPRVPALQAALSTKFGLDYPLRGEPAELR